MVFEHGQSKFVRATRLIIAVPTTFPGAPGRRVKRAADLYDFSPYRYNSRSVEVAEVKIAASKKVFSRPEWRNWQTRGIQNPVWATR